MSALRAKRPGGGVPARSRDYYLDAGREYVRRYGAEQMTQAAFNPGTAKRDSRLDLVEAYYAGRENGEPWPSLNALRKAFDGKFNNFREALDLPPNSTGPARGRRPAGTALPIRSVREVRRVIPDSTVADLQRQLQKAERRADRLAAELDAAKANVRVVEDHQKIDRLRQRLADESARRREAARGLTNAIRREERARIREAALREAARGDAALLREVDRLTTRLADAETRVRELSTGSPVPTKTVVRTVREADPQTLRRIDRQEVALERARVDRDHAEARCTELAERLADIRQEAIAVAIVDGRVRAAERRAEAAERTARDVALLLVGEARQLTENEIQTLRRDGPAGKPLVVRALRKLIRARHWGGRDDQISALTELASAAYSWRDRLTMR